MNWETLIEELDRKYQNEEQIFEALAISEAGDQAFPEDILARGKQIFATIAALAGDKICNSPEVKRVLDANGPRVSEAMTIVPLLINLLPNDALKDVSIALAALLIARMGLGLFCQLYVKKRQNKK